MNVPILIAGVSGSGKSSTFRNLPPDKTLIINTERKPMPFRSFKSFKNVNVSKYKDFIQLLGELAKDTKYEYVVIDSLTSLTEIIQKYVDSVFSGFEQWKQYNEAIQTALWGIKDLENKQVFITGIPEYMEVGPGEQKAFIKVKGKEWKYAIEKEFAIVLWTKLIQDESGEISNYQLEYKPNKANTAKSPDGMFEGEIANDAKILADSVKAYYGDES